MMPGAFDEAHLDFSFTRDVEVCAASDNGIFGNGYDGVSGICTLLTPTPLTVEFDPPDSTWEVALEEVSSGDGFESMAVRGAPPGEGGCNLWGLRSAPDLDELPDFWCCACWLTKVCSICLFSSSNLRALFWGLLDKSVDTSGESWDDPFVGEFSEMVEEMCSKDSVRDGLRLCDGGPADGEGALVGVRRAVFRRMLGSPPPPVCLAVACVRAR